MTDAYIDDTDPGPDPVEEARAAVLDEALPDVPFDGWSEALLRRAIADAGVDPATARLAFPRGAIDLAAAFHRRGDALMRERLAAQDLTALRIRERVTLAVRLRIEAIGPHKEAVRRAASLFALPPNAPLGARLGWGTADAIWTALGDPSQDYNWYSKRLILSGVYGATVLYWLGDASEDYTATWAFLDRRIDGVMRFEKTKASAARNPLLRAAFIGPRWALSMVRAPGAGGAPIGFPGRNVYQKGMNSPS